MKKSCFKYHLDTSYERNKLTGHYLDWENQPVVYKRYPGIDPVLLRQDVCSPEKKLSSLLKHSDMGTARVPINVELLSQTLRLTYTLTAKSRHSGGDFYYRSVASAGALYPTEIYVAAHGVDELEDGLYHFSIARHGLSLLRKGNLSLFIKKTTQPLDTSVPVLTFFLSAIFYRSAWKYRERSYRYHLLDTGHLLENLILALEALRLPTALSLDFDDAEVNRLLGLDETKEVCLAVCTVPGTAAYDNGEVREIPDLGDAVRAASRVSQKEADYPELIEIHTAGAPIRPKSKSIPAMTAELGLVPGKWKAMTPPDPWPETLDYAETVFHRRSRRNFVQKPISKACLTALLDGLCAGDHVESDREVSYPYPTICTGFLAGNAEGFDPGFYLVDTSSYANTLVDPGLFPDRMARICLDQMWVANAAVHFIFMSNLDIVDRIWGPRGYRYAMMTAGRLGERLYLMATAMGLGCCGIGAFYDMEAADLLGLNTASQPLYLVAIGPVKSIKGF